MQGRSWSVLGNWVPAKFFAPQSQVALPSVDIQLVALMRCLLALVALVAVSMEMHQSASSAALFASLVAYWLYSVSLCAIGFQRGFAARSQPWIDALFFAYLIGLTNGSDSIFFHYFFFAIVIAAFSRGFREGIGVTLFAALSFVVIALVGYAGGMQVELTQAASRFIALLVLGYMISCWGGNELAVRRRMRLLSELASPVAPPVTLERLISGQLAQLLDFFRAQAAFVVLPAANGACRIYRSDVARSAPALLGDELREELARPLLGLPPVLRMSFDADRGRRPCTWLPDGDADHVRQVIETRSRGLANLLETRRFVSVPYQPAEGLTGRLYVISPARRFTRADTEFLGHVAAQLAAAANNAMLMQELTATAARQERSKISRDIHDTTVQSYIGLKLGLEALYRDVGKEGGAAPRIKELLDIATSTVDDLRHYVDRLRERGGARNAQLLARIDEQRRRYVTLHGINVDVRADSQLAIGDATSVEAYQFVCEALSNIARHTSAKRASIDLRREGDSLAIEVGNECAQHSGTKPFIPRSITERAMSLGGNVQVSLNDAGRDVVRVTIPLSAQAPASPQPSYAR